MNSTAAKNIEQLVAFKGTAAQIEFATRVRDQVLAGIDSTLAEFNERLSFERSQAPANDAFANTITARIAYWTQVRAVIAQRLSSASWLLDRRGGVYPVLVDLPYFVDTVAKLAGITRP